jgi:hypothetical protein
VTEYRRKRGVQATKIPVGMKTERGLTVRAGEWLVVDEDGGERALSEEEFRAEFEPAGAPASRTSLARRGEDRLAREDDEPRRRRGKKSTGLARLGDGLEKIVGGILNPKKLLPGVRVVDEKTGAIVYERRQGLEVDTGGAPTVSGMKVNERGEVVGMDVKPEEWPPRGEKF